ncbi:MAG: protein translocase subunit SecD, partial [Clostridia bacterium]|nr:protein translocase subunit SecD [Clostridia bacterium]
MKRTPKWAFFVVAVLIFALSFTAIFGVYQRFGDRTDTIIRGVSDIRWGIDIQGGVDVVFGPVDENVDPTDEQLDAVKTIIEQRMVSKNITDYEAYTDPANNQVIVRFPWASTTETP